MGREEATNTHERQRQPEERRVVDVGVLSDRSWLLYSDGTFEGETVDGTQRFKDFEHFKSFVESSPAVRAVSFSKQPQPPQTSQIQTTSPINAPLSETTEAVVLKRLMPRLLGRAINGLAVIVIFCSEWIMLSELVRLEEAKQLKEATRLEEAKKLDDTDKNISAIERLQSVKLLDWTWRAEGYVPIMVASSTVQNTNEFDVKDVEITCEFLENTGAFVDRTITTIYDIIKAKSSKAFNNFTMGVMHYQVIFSVPHPITSNDCRISNFARTQL
jgi:hypothetical protein